MAAAVAKPGQTLRRSRPSLNTKQTTRSAITDGTDAPRKRLQEPYVRDTSYILRKHRGRPVSLIVHLHPTHFRFDQQDGSFSYDSPMKSFLQHIRRQTVPHEILEELLENNVPFYDGALLLPFQPHSPP